MRSALFVATALAAAAAAAPPLAHLKWNVTLPNPTASPVNSRGFPVPNAKILALERRTLYAYTDETMTLNAIDLDTGAHAWSVSNIDTAQSIFFPTVGGPAVLLVKGGDNGDLHGIDADTGATLWRQPEAPGCQLSAGPTNGNLVDLDVNHIVLQCVNNDDDQYWASVEILTGNVEWTRPSAENPALRCDGRDGILSVARSNTLFVTQGVDADNGTTLWTGNYWGDVLGCSDDSGGCHERYGCGVVLNVTNTGPRTFVSFAVETGRVQSVIPAPAAFQTTPQGVAPTMLLFKNVACALAPGTCAACQLLHCVDVHTGRDVVKYNLTANGVAFADIVAVPSTWWSNRGLADDVALVSRNYATGGTGKVLYFSPLDSKQPVDAPIATVNFETPYRADTPYTPGTGVTPGAVVFNNDAGFTIVRRHGTEGTAVNVQVATGQGGEAATTRASGIASNTDGDKWAAVSQNRGWGYRLA